MKKKILSLTIASAMLLGTVPTYAMTNIMGSADASTDVYVAPFQSSAPEIPYDENIVAQFGIEGAANIYYNSQYLDPAIIIGSRTMLPFRSFLEAIGAEVNYDDATRTASATRFDTTVSFNLDSDVISITNEHGNKEIIMDVKPVIIEGHSYVTVRFLSEAFDMQVGWDGYDSTALIVDYERLSADMSNNCPNLTKISELGVVIPDRATASTTLGIDFNLMENQEEMTFNLGLTSEGSSVGNDAETSSTLSFEVKTPEESFELKDTTIDVVTTDNTFYLKTDILDKIAAAGIDTGIGDNVFSKDSWYMISLDNYLALLSSYTGGELDVESIKSLMDNQNDPTAVIEYMLKNQGELYGTYSVDAITTMFSVIPLIDKYFVIEETGDSATVSFKFTEDDIYVAVEEFVRANIPELSEDEINEGIAEMKAAFAEVGFDCDISLAMKIENKVVVDQDVSISFAASADDIKLDCFVSAVSKIDPTATVADIEAPENAVNIFSKLFGI